ncbi:MAG: helix-turn-helix domain-containing protein [Pseudomonadota bacterium]
MKPATRPKNETAPQAPAGKTSRGRPRTTDSAPVGIQAVDIALDILKHLVMQSTGMSLSEMSRATGLQPSKLHRYLVSFGRHGLLRQSAVTGEYDFGPLARKIGTAAFNRHHGLKVVHEALTSLAAESGWTAALYIWTELGPTLVRLEMGTKTLPVVLREGTALPVTGSGTGRVFLAYLQESLSRDFIQQERELGEEEGFRIWSDKDLAAEIAKIRSERIYWTAEAIFPGSIGVAPVFESNGNIHSVITLIPQRGQNTKPARQRLTRLLEAKLDMLAAELS